ncbi:MAG TPA: hypothetical protein VGU66_18085 [Candidatus Elarobacter sp.]|nr:hypothetical protein [Candidatus Elarobacter sp.]
MSNEDRNDDVVFLAPESIGTATVAPTVGKYGEEQQAGPVETVRRWLRLKPVTVTRDKLQQELSKVRGHIGLILTDLGPDGEHGFNLEEVTVGITVSADGHFGIATVGAETTLELTFKRK